MMKKVVIVLFSLMMSGCAGIISVLSTDLPRMGQKWDSHYEFIRKRPSLPLCSSHKVMFWTMNGNKLSYDGKYSLLAIGRDENISIERRLICDSSRGAGVCFLSCREMWETLKLNETPYNKLMVERYGYCDVVGAYVMAGKSLKNRWEMNYNGTIITYMRPELLRTKLKENGREWLKTNEQETFEQDNLQWN